MSMLLENPVVAAVKDDQGLATALESNVSVIFLLYGDLLSIVDLTERIHAGGKRVFIHMDLVDGLASREITVDYLAKMTCADGIISTKQQLLRRAAALGLYTVQRFFLLDSIAIANMEKSLDKFKPDFIEVLPGAMPKMIAKISKRIDCPIIAGGLLSDKEDVVQALAAGVVAVSSSRPEIWQL